MDKNNDSIRRLKQSGLKNTKHRTTILNMMKQSDDPMPAEQIYIQLKEEGVSINLSTVYRTLEVLTERGLLNKHSIINDSRALYEYNRRVHKHFLVCMGCKKMLTIEHCPLEEYEKTLEKETDFIISGHKLDIYGYCADCQKKLREQSSDGEE